MGSDQQIELSLHRGDSLELYVKRRLHRHQQFLVPVKALNDGFDDRRDYSGNKRLKRCKAGLQRFLSPARFRRQAFSVTRRPRASLPLVFTLPRKSAQCVSQSIAPRPILFAVRQEAANFALRDWTHARLK
jgi:hypothetical protein